MNTLRRIDDLLAAAERCLVVALFAALVSILVFTIAGRNLFHHSEQWLLELNPVLVLWLALLGGSLALRRGRHIRLEVLLRHTPPPVQRGAAVVANAFGALVMAVLLYASFSFVRSEVDLFGSRGWLAAVFPVFFTVAAFRFALQMLAALLEGRRGPGTHPPPKESGP